MRSKRFSRNVAWKLNRPNLRHFVNFKKKNENIPRYSLTPFLPLCNYKRSSRIHLSTAFPRFPERQTSSNGQTTFPCWLELLNGFESWVSREGRREKGEEGGGKNKKKIGRRSSPSPQDGKDGMSGIGSFISASRLPPRSICSLSRDSARKFSGVGAGGRGG